MKRYIYFDFAATTPVDKRVLEAMVPYFSEKFGNSVSLHRLGQEALMALDFSRDALRKYVNAKSLREIIFTSNATESNNIALKGVALYSFFRKKIKPHIITTTIEHSSIGNVVKNLFELGIAEIDFVSPNKNGLIDIEILKTLIKENTVLVSIHYVNSEIGVVQKVKEIGELLENLNKNRKSKIYFHIDAAQAGLTEVIDVQELKCDLLTFSSHKIYGPKGVALLYIKDGTEIEPLFSGGQQEYGFRPGTVAVPLVVGFAKAVEILQNEFHQIKNHLTKIRDYFATKIKEINVESNTDISVSSPKICNLYFPSKTSQEILIYLDQNGFAISPGTACTARAMKSSQVVSEVFRDENRGKKSVRFSFGKETTEEDIDLLISTLKKFV